MNIPSHGSGFAGNIVGPAVLVGGNVGGVPGVGRVGGGVVPSKLNNPITINRNQPHP
jgi:hypothetical protein